MDKHQTLIEQLIPFLQADDFADIFQKLTFDLASSEQFLLKMELNRLNQPSNRVIDLRKKLTGCQPRDIANAVHHLNSATHTRLQELMQIYGDRLTVGVYEALMEEVKQLQESKTAEPEPEPQARLPQILGHYLTRTESRRTFSTAIRVQQYHEVCDGITLDISIGGCQIRLDETFELDLKEPITLAFTEFGREFLAPLLRAGLSYKILGISQRKGYQYVRLQRIEPELAQSQELARVLQACSLRTVPEINHLVATTRTHGYERHYLSKLSGLPVFFKQKDRALVASFSIGSHLNNDIYQYWKNEIGINQLSVVLNMTRLTLLLKEPNNPDHQLLYSFIHQQKDQDFFFTATLHELKQAGLQDAFLATASKRDSFRIFRLSAHTLNAEDLTLALQSPISGQQADALVRNQLTGLCLQVMMEQIGSEDATAQYQKRKLSDDPNVLRCFGLPRTNKDPLRLVPLTHYDQRRETRFSLHTQVVISLEGKTFTGQTLDVSPHGMKIQLAEPLVNVPSKESLIAVELPRLQELAGKLKLKEMPYRLVRAQKNAQTLHLRAEGNNNHSGVVFLSHLLSQNRKKLSEIGSARQHGQMLDGLKTLMFKRLHGLPIFAHKTQKAQSWDLLGQAKGGTALLSTLVPNNPPQLDWLWQLTALESRLAQLRHLEQLQWECLLKLPTAEHDADALVLLPEQESEQRRSFMLEAVSEQRFMALNIRIFRANKPDLDYLQPDLAAISTHALHRARELEAVLWQVKACGQLIDITEEILYRYTPSPT